jgi:hypothetical protein
MPLADTECKEPQVSSIKNHRPPTDDAAATAYKRRFLTRLTAVLVGGMFLDGYTPSAATAGSVSAAPCSFVEGAQMSPTVKPLGKGSSGSST